LTTKGRLVVATPQTADENFDRTVVLMVEHTDEGALGLVLNRPGGIPVGEILPTWEAVATEPSVMYVGGPVERDAVLALGSHRDVDRAAEADGAMIIDPIGVVDLSRDPEEVAGEIDGLRLFSGYAGWGPSQLDAEIDAGGWILVDAAATDVLTEEAEGLWRAVLARQVDPALRRLALYPADIAHN
jgi:putative transcriptional regulator